MTWLEAVSSSIKYIEMHLCDDLTADEIASEVCISPIYFQKGFSILCGISVSEYIRNRRLSLAGKELRSGGAKVIDVALKYGYDSPDSFTKAFTRFHGITPKQAKDGEGELKQYLPLQIHISMQGGFDMECKIIRKKEFTVIGSERVFKGDQGQVECPKFWDEHYSCGDGEYISGMYGICIDEIEGKPGYFRYLIADDYDASRRYPEKFVTEVIPENTWAVFPCVGPMPEAMHAVYGKIFSEWLPQNRDYEIAGKYNIETYSCPSRYPNGTQDKDYYSEIWIPVK